MADYATLLNAEKKKTSPSPTKDIQHVQNSDTQNSRNPENLPARAEESQKENFNIPPLRQLHSQKTNERTNERNIERHSFDIFIDQKMGLDELQLMLYQKHGKKPKIGSLVREAIDDLFKKYKNERKNE